MNKRVLLNRLNSFIPKADIILFNSFPDLSDSSWALYSYILNNRRDIVNNYKLVWSTSEDANLYAQKLDRLFPNNSNKVIRKKSIVGLLTYFRAKYVVTTHGYFGGSGSVKNQKHIELWHGMPLKTIGNGLKQQSSTGFGIDADITFATSDVFRDIVAEAFGINNNAVYITGLPRNDLLLREGKGLSSMGIISKYKKVIMWMPTYRKSIVGDVRSDGDENGFGIKEILYDNFSLLNDILISEEYLLIVKPHPMDALANENLPSSDNVMIIRDYDLQCHDASLYSLLADSDLLITDYSSVFVDYLITGKPIAFACSDMKEYADTRGFFFDNVEDYMPGELLTTKDAFFDYLKDIESYAEKWEMKYQILWLMITLQKECAI